MISSFSSGGNCVAVAWTDDEVVVSHSKQPEQGEVHFGRKEWAEFIAGVKAGEFDVEKTE